MMTTLEVIAFKEDRERSTIQAVSTEAMMQKPTAAKVMMPALSRPQDGTLRVGEEEFLLFLTLPGVMTPLNSATWIAQVGVLFAMRKFYVWAARKDEEQAAVDLIIDRDTFLQHWIATETRKHPQTEASAFVDQAKKMFLSHIPLLEQHKEFATWSANENVFIVFGLQTESNLVL